MLSIWQLALPMILLVLLPLDVQPAAAVVGVLLTGTVSGCNGSEEAVRVQLVSGGVVLLGFSGVIELHVGTPTPAAAGVTVAVVVMVALLRAMAALVGRATLALQVVFADVPGMDWTLFAMSCCCNCCINCNWSICCCCRL